MPVGPGEAKHSREVAKVWGWEGRARYCVVVSGSSSRSVLGLGSPVGEIPSRSGPGATGFGLFFFVLSEQIKLGEATETLGPGQS